MNWFSIGTVLKLILFWVFHCSTTQNIIIELEQVLLLENFGSKHLLRLIQMLRTYLALSVEYLICFLNATTADMLGKYHCLCRASNTRRRSLKKHRKFPGHASLIAKYEELFPVLA
ncbi:hypothetical protein GW17_00018875 [Ensete ventricosum]|nr:hypothetical protein GW17_00018875 [Ensete ventricosum]